MLETKIKSIIASTGMRQADLARKMGITPMLMNYKVTKCKTIKNLLELADMCDAELILRKRDGSVQFPITLDDVSDGEKE